MKKILLLGGSYPQIPAIVAAKQKGLHTILCDYLPDNPGRAYADEYYSVSTTDREAVLKLAKQHKTDFVLAYASDPAAPTAAYVSEKLGLPGNSYTSVKKLSEKNLFRKLQRDNGFNMPKTLTLNSEQIQKGRHPGIEFPLVVKPTDSAGSKGVKKVNSKNEFETAASHALTFSKSKRIIVEEFIDAGEADLHGDGFVVNGELEFCLLGDHIFDSKANPLNPNGTTWPSTKPTQYIETVTRDVASVIKLSGFKNGGINIEARVNSKGRVYIMEIGARNGGHFVPQAIHNATGFDMTQATIDLLLTGTAQIHTRAIKPSAYYALFSDKVGLLKHIEISEELHKYIAKKHIYVNPGEPVNSYLGASNALGVLVMTFDSSDVMSRVIASMEEHISISLK
jgi:biotin carboxylase